MRADGRVLDTPDGPMRCYEAAPEAPTRAIVVIQEAFGVNAHIEDVTRRFAAAGYHAIAPDLFHRADQSRGGSGGTAEYGDFDTVIKLFGSISGDADLVADVDAVLGHLHGEGFAGEHIGIVGFCFGGRVSFLLALERALGAAVGFYGGGIVTGRFPQFPTLIERAATLQTPWLGLFGDQDGSIPVDDVERLRDVLGATAVDTDIVRYPTAKHGFHCDVRDDFDPEAAADVWQRTLAWFAEHL